MNKKGNKKDTIIKYLLLTFIIICSIFRYKTIYLDSGNVLEASLSNFLYPFTFLFIIMIYKTENFSNAHKTILKTSLIFIIFMMYGYALGVTAKELDTAYWAFDYENPQLYWLGNSYTYSHIRDAVQEVFLIYSRDEGEVQSLQEVLDKVRDLNLTLRDDD